MAEKDIYDSIIIGGGPAGLSAGIYLGRALRRVLIMDAGGGRTSWNQKNDNYFGFPNGIRAGELVRRGQRQAQRFGVEFCAMRVNEVRRESDHFCVELEGDAARYARTIIFATGVTDVWPDFSSARSYIGKSLFWCIHCDGFRTLNKKVVVLGNSDEAATTALQLLDYTPHVTFLVSGLASRISQEKQDELESNGISISLKAIKKVQGKAGKFKALWLEDDECLELDYMFSALGQVPNSQLAAGLGIELSGKGCIVVDMEQKTNVPGAFGAGDVTNLPAQQVVSAVHQGAIAAVSANYLLRPGQQKVAETAVKPV